MKKQKGVNITNSRMFALKQKLGQSGFDGIVVSKGTDVRYLSNFTGDIGTTVLFVTKRADYLITDGRFEFQAAEETEGFEIIVWRTGSSIFRELGLLIHKLRLNKIGICPDEISYGDYLKVKAECGAELTECERYVENLRAVKDDGELALIRKACAISDASFASLLDFIRPGVTEMDVVNALEFEFRKRGSEGCCFETIVASGPDNGANCHATPTKRKIESGDMITIDFGAFYEGYCSDITRTVALGEPDPRLVKIYSIVKEAKSAAQAVLKEGVTLKEINAAAVNVIEENGYKIPHGPGHSFGLDIHEFPFISPKVDYSMPCNTVHTLEPGIYIPGIGGVRIEDDYLIKKEGAEQLTHCNDELIIL